MPRNHACFRCRECSAVSVRWVGRCPQCGEWNTLVEEEPPRQAAGASSAATVVALDGPPTGSVADPMATGLGELDRVLGGGIVPGSVTLIAGEPGIGKSTLLLQMLAGMAAAGRSGLLVSAEESIEQVRRRAERMGALHGAVGVCAATELPAIRAAVRESRPDVAVVDSIQTIHAPDLGATSGTVGQVRACAQALCEDAKASGAAVVLVGHVTKDGAIAGPRALEHLVDTVLSFEGDRHQGLRLLRAVKHRFGPVGELGMWEMAPSGLREVADAGAFLLADRRPGLPGSVVFAGMEGRRPLLVEIQALVGSSAGGPMRRSASGYDSSRLGQLLAVLERRAGLSLAGQDVYVSAVGGVRVAEPAADLAVALAVASAATGAVVPGDVVAFGEVGLGGELRQVPHLAARLGEAARHGFGAAAVPPVKSAAESPLQIRPTATLLSAIDRSLRPAAPPPRLRVVGSGSAGS